MIYLKLAWYLLRQELTQISQILANITTLVLMTFVVTLSLSGSNVQHYLTGNLHQLLGADAVISHRGALTSQLERELLSFATEHAMTKSSTTTLTHGDNWANATLKAVDNAYPLQGKLVIADDLGNQEYPTVQTPKSGELWLDSRLISSLAIEIGQSLSLGGQVFTVTKVLHHEPDRLMQSHSVAMRGMMNKTDFNRLNIADDTVNYRYLLASTNQQIGQLSNWQKHHLATATLYHKQGAHPLATFWQRTENFLGLSSVILFFMAAIAFDQLAGKQAARDGFRSAVFHSVGASPSTGVILSVIKWLLQLALLLPIVIAFATGFHHLIIQWLSSTFDDLTPRWDLLVALKGFCATAVLLLVFQLPIWFAIATSSVGKLIQQRNITPNRWMAKCSALLVLCLVSVFYTDNGLLSLMVLLSVGITITMVLVVSWCGLTAGEKLSRNLSGLAPFALFMMKQRLISKSTQILGVGLCAFLLLFTLMLMRDLGETMSHYSRAHDGNVLVSQASEEQIHYIEQLALQEQFEIRQNKRFVYAKLTRVNQQLLTDFNDKPSDSLATLQSPIRMHWSRNVPSNNRVVEGRWWKVEDSNWQQVSVESEVMTDLGLNIGDTLTFAIGLQTLDFTIAASHVYQPGQGSITFWVQMPAAAISHISAPQYAMASLELDEDNSALLATMWRTHPTLRMASLKTLTARFDATLAIVTDVIVGFSGLIVLLSALVIIASVQGQENSEKRKNSVIMSFGLNRRTCLKLNIIEWFMTGLIAAGGAIIGTYVAGLLIYDSQFSLTYQPDITWMLMTLAVLVKSVTTLGMSASSHSLRASIRQLMQE